MRMKSSAQNARTSGRIDLNGRVFYLSAKFCLIIAFYLLFTILFYRQAVEYNGAYFSDLPAHINFGVNGANYSLLFRILGAIYKLPWPNLAVALLESSMVVLTFSLSEKYIRTHFEISSGLAAWISAGTLFLSSIYIPGIYPYYYKWTLITQSWHNITYLGMRLFSVPVFFHTLYILERYRERFVWKDWLILAISLLLGAAIKPNYLVNYSLTLLCVLIVDFVRDCFRKELSIPSFFGYVFLGSTVFPAVMILFYQMFILYGGQTGPGNGMRLVFLTSQYFSQGMTNAAVGIARDIAFPLLVVVCGYRFFSRREKFVLLLFVLTLIQRIVLEETGLREEHLNFSWGIYNAGYLLFLYMVPKFVQLVKMTPWVQKDLKDKGFVLAGSGLLWAHLVSGFIYFAIVFSGKYYYI